MKKWIALFCIFAMTLGLMVGCADPQTTETQDAGQTQATEEVTQVTQSKGLDGKKVLFVGDSFLFTGRAVLLNKEVTEEGRRYDTGYFYQLCKANGAEVAVTN